MYSESDKLQCEVRKLIAEERNLSRSFWHQPPFWLTVSTLALSMIGNIAQYSSAKREEQLSTLKKERLDLDTVKLRDQELVLKQSTSALAEKEAALQAEVGEKEQLLSSIQQEIADVGVRLASRKAELDEHRISNAAFNDDVRDSAATLQGITERGTRQLEHPSNRARDDELQGFDALTRGDFQAAQTAFQAAEDAVNGYHHAYEIARLLRARRNMLRDEGGKKAVLRAIVTQYYGYAPPEQLQKLKEMIKE